MRPMRPTPAPAPPAPPPAVPIPPFRLPTSHIQVDLPYRFVDDGVEIEVRSAARMPESERRIWGIDSSKDWYSVYVILKETQNRSKMFEKPPIHIVGRGGLPIHADYFFATELGTEKIRFSVRANERRELKAVFNITGMSFPLHIRLTEGVYILKDE